MFATFLYANRQLTTMTLKTNPTFKIWLFNLSNKTENPALAKMIIKGYVHHVYQSNLDLTAENSRKGTIIPEHKASNGTLSLSFFLKTKNICLC